MWGWVGRERRRENEADQMCSVKNQTQENQESSSRGHVGGLFSLGELPESAALAAALATNAA